jgi:hypothetical protein
MNRLYQDGSRNNVNFFLGQEVEKTPAYGLPTLFIVGLQPIEQISKILNKKVPEVSHIFFGANHSFKDVTVSQIAQWEHMILSFLNKGYWCSLDIPLQESELILEASLNEYNTFIPQLRVPVPFIKSWNYNTTVKIDDTGFDVSNPGVWCHPLHELMTREKFTDWTQYKSDKEVL